MSTISQDNYPSTSLVHQALWEFLETKQLTLGGIISCKPQEQPTSIVAVVTNDFSKVGPMYWVLRISNWEDDHRASKFVEAWRNKDCTFLPQMVPIVDYAYDGAQFIIEQYEYVGYVPSKTDVGKPASASENESSYFHDLHQYLSDALFRRDSTAYNNSFLYLSQAITALAELHNSCWFHLDFSLENIAYDQNRAVLIDFEAALRTATPIFVEQRDVRRSCKIEYTAPEVNGPLALVDPAGVDVWAVGVSLYYMAVGSFPFEVTEETDDVKKTRRSLFEYIRVSGFLEYLAIFKRDGFERLEHFPFLADLLEDIFVVYSQTCDDDPAVYWTTEKPRLTCQQVMDHRFWLKYGDDISIVSTVVADDRQLQVEDMDVDW